MKNDAKVFLFTILDMWLLKIQNALKLIVQILHTLNPAKIMDNLKKLTQMKTKKR